MKSPDDRITIRFDRRLGKKIRALAKRRGLSVAEYCRLMCSLEVLHEEPDHPFTLLQQQLKETLAEVEEFAQLEPQHQADALRRALGLFTAAKTARKTLDQAMDQAIAWLQAFARASDAFSRANVEPPKGTSREPTTEE